MLFLQLANLRSRGGDAGVVRSLSAPETFKKKILIVDFFFNNKHGEYKFILSKKYFIIFNLNRIRIDRTTE